MTKYEEIVKFLSTLVKMFEKKEGIYKDDYWPLSYLPPNLDPNSKEAALYIFYFVQIDYQTKGDRLVRKMKEYYLQNPDFIYPDYILSLTDDEIAKIIKACGGRFPTKDNKVWKYNSQVLLERFDGDPRKIGENVTVKELKERTKEFKTLGAHGKLFWLWTTIMIDPDINLWKIQDIENIVVPVDIWIFRWAKKIGLSSQLNYNKKAQEEIGKLLAKICSENNLPLTKINHILWKYLRENFEDIKI